VTFSVYGPGDTGCTTPLETAPPVPLQAGSARSADFLAQQAGEFRWTASYSGDANNEPVSSACGALGQTSNVSKAAPTLTGVATSALTPGLTISDEATLAAGFAPGGELIFRAYGPDDAICATTPKYEDEVTIAGNGTYSVPGFKPSASGLYRWTVSYPGDGNNEHANSVCGATNQGSAVGTIPISLTASATDAKVGEVISAAAVLTEGGIPGGQLTFSVYAPNDTTCTGSPAFSSVAAVSGNGTYRSATFSPTRVGAFRWTAAYSGDPNHAPATAACGKATSTVSQAKPVIAGAVKRQLLVGRAFKDWTTLVGGYAPTGTIKFQIFGPGTTGCDGPLFIDTVTVRGNGTFSSDPFVARVPGRYWFVARYSGDVSNQATAEPCNSAEQETSVEKRTPKLKPRGFIVSGRLISIRAILSGTNSPSGAINFRLYPPGDKLCKRRPTFGGAITVSSNGAYSLAQYLAARRGLYRLSVGYSGDQRNRQIRGACSEAQSIRVG
jgi:hypothetical protein